MAKVGKVQRALYRHLCRTTRDLDARIRHQTGNLELARELKRFSRFVPGGYPLEPALATSEAAGDSRPEKESGAQDPVGEHAANIPLHAAAREHQLLTATLRRCFDELPNSSDRIDAGFEALRFAQRRLDLVSAPDWSAKPLVVLLDVGQVFRHKKHGFRGVVVEWWESCPADDAWFEAYGKDYTRGREQPFYRLLPKAICCIYAHTVLPQ